MSQPITPQLFLAVRQMLRAGLRHCEIARELNLSVWTIAKIADRRRYLPDGENGAASGQEVPAEELCEDDAPPDYLAKNLRRCPECGAMVYVWPCISCSHGASAPPIAPQEEEAEPEPGSPANGQAHRPEYLKRKLRLSRWVKARANSPRPTASGVTEAAPDHAGDTLVSG
jgi:hypothetical protein